jgi:WhiB family transcriptional regulator, redox-sensing transcriptional regulator
MMRHSSLDRIVTSTVAGTFPGLTGLDAQPWAAQALCAQIDPEAWFPDKGGSTRAAKALCRNCEVREECLAWALAHHERYGIWGGLSERERRQIEKPAGAA